MKFTSTDQRTAVVSGVGSERGIGRATARRLAREGWAVVGADLDGAAAEKLAADLTEEFGVPALGAAVDVTSAHSVAELHRLVHDRGLPTVGAVVPIAGIASPTPILDVDLALWEKVFAVNSTGTYVFVQPFLRDMVDAGFGRVVTMSSVSAQQGGGVFSKTPYSAAKAAVLGYTRSLAREVGPHGITVNSVSPGAVDTDIRVGATDDEKEAAIAAASPLGRQASVDDIAALIAFLASDDASYITGATINVNGGSYIS
jgi:2-hydroxycyclohexanecarboxyl-CoA dehydrogenase